MFNVMNKSSLTQEALQNDSRKSNMATDLQNSCLVHPTDCREYDETTDDTQKRKQVSIPQIEAKKARQAAAMMSFEPCWPFHEIHVLRGDEKPVILADNKCF
jgi:hypothetical protein